MEFSWRDFGFQHITALICSCDFYWALPLSGKYEVVSLTFVVELRLPSLRSSFFDITNIFEVSDVKWNPSRYATHRVRRADNTKQGSMAEIHSTLSVIFHPQFIPGCKDSRRQNLHITCQLVSGIILHYNLINILPDIWAWTGMVIWSGAGSLRHRSTIAVWCNISEFGLPFCLSKRNRPLCVFIYKYQRYLIPVVICGTNW